MGRKGSAAIDQEILIQPLRYRSRKEGAGVKGKKYGK